MSTCSILAATLMQIPMGLLADKKGMKIALILNIISTILYWGWLPLIAIILDLPSWALYIAPVFILIGGGPWASGALIFAAINQRISARQRTPAFSIMEAISGIADLLGPALGTLTMENHIGIPFLLAIISFTLMFMPTALLQNELALLPIEIDDIRPETEVSRPGDSEERPLLRSNSADSIDSQRSSIHSTMIIYVITFGSFFLISLARDSNNFLIPWISWRFNETMARWTEIGVVHSRFDNFIVKHPAPLCRVNFYSALNEPSDPGSWILHHDIGVRRDRSLIGMPLMGALYSLSISEDTVNISWPFAMAAVAYFLVSCVIGSLQLIN
ncbi:hypothetical protein NPX13_g4481 [Xylaria arbuscula]|uniref:Uncharacterized protein n=1 Tax=Xylaria arbuscula TaxID=114810 RepID=A0A9W8NGQ9_9PEZI|nr:hypothetical protein NPX13_g4481 [Xylaria arbuscula]